MTTSQLEDFVSFMVKSGCGCGNNGKVRVCRPFWWPRGLPFRFPIEQCKTNGLSWRETLHHLAARCFAAQTHFRRTEQKCQQNGGLSVTLRDRGKMSTRHFNRVLRNHQFRTAKCSNSGGNLAVSRVQYGVSVIFPRKYGHNNGRESTTHWLCDSPQLAAKPAKTTRSDTKYFLSEPVSAHVVNCRSVRCNSGKSDRCQMREISKWPPNNRQSATGSSVSISGFARGRNGTARSDADAKCFLNEPQIVGSVQCNSGKNDKCQMSEISKCPLNNSQSAVANDVSSLTDDSVSDISRCASGRNCTEVRNVATWLRDRHKTATSGEVHPCGQRHKCGKNQDRSGDVATWLRNKRTVSVSLDKSISRFGDENSRSVATWPRGRKLRNLPSPFSANSDGCSTHSSVSSEYVPIVSLCDVIKHKPITAQNSVSREPLDKTQFLRYFNLDDSSNGPQLSANDTKFELPHSRTVIINSPHIPFSSDIGKKLIEKSNVPEETRAKKLERMERYTSTQEFSSAKKHPECSQYEITFNKNLNKDCAHFYIFPTKTYHDPNKLTPKARYLLEKKCRPCFVPLTPLPPLHLLSNLDSKHTSNKENYSHWPEVRIELSKHLIATSKNLIATDRASLKSPTTNNELRVQVENCAKIPLRVKKQVKCDNLINASVVLTSINSTGTRRSVLKSGRDAGTNFKTDQPIRSDDK